MLSRDQHNKMDKITSYCKLLTRTKSNTESFQLQPVLTTFSLTFLGLGITIGTGLFILTGHVARENAGPSVVLSVLLAALVSFPSALCYAEFGCRFRQAGSAYIYTYTSVGEVYAFIVGWNIFLEYIISASAQGRAIVEYIDVILNGKLDQVNVDIFGDIEVTGLSHSFNLIGLLITVLMTLVALTGSQGTARSNEVLTTIKISAAVFIILVGSFYTNTDNWSNFMPYGIQGVIKGTAACFFGYVGFDAIATASEEAKDPKHSVPIAIFSCLCSVCALYIGVTVVLTLMVPYNKLYPQAPLVHAFEQVGLSWAKYIVLFSGIAAMLTVLLTSIFAASRIIYSMACDGLIFKAFSAVGEKRIIPVRAIILSGSITAVMTFFLDLNAIIEMMNLGTLISYIFVAVAVLLVRFTPEKPSDSEVESTTDEGDRSFSWWNKIWKGKNADYDKLQSHHENEAPSLTNENKRIVCICITLMIVMWIIVLSILNFAFSDVVSGSPGVVSALVLSSLVLICTIVPLFYLPAHRLKFGFTVPLVPITPIISIALDLFLILNLNWLTWIRTVIWLFIGFFIYFFYGVHNSVQGKADMAEVPSTFIQKFAPSENQESDDFDIVEKSK